MGFSYPRHTTEIPIYDFLLFALVSPIIICVATPNDIQGCSQPSGDGGAHSFWPHAHADF